MAHHLDGKLVRAAPLRLESTEKLMVGPAPAGELVGVLVSMWVPELAGWRLSVNGVAVDPASVTIADPLPSDWAVGDETG